MPDMPDGRTSLPSDAERIADALESIAVSFAVIAEAMMRDDEGTTTGPPRNPLRTMDQPDEPSGN